MKRFFILMTALSLGQLTYAAPLSPADHIKNHLENLSSSNHNSQPSSIYYGGQDILRLRVAANTSATITG